MGYAAARMGMRLRSFYRDRLGGKSFTEKGDNVPDDIELHKPFIDRDHDDSARSAAAPMHSACREVIDCWYDSGSMPFAQWHYPFENTEAFERRFPAHFISEAVDQTRGWFYTLLAIGTLVFGTNPFENCIVLGHVQDKDGQKMSKHKGNVVDPWTVLDGPGADAVRWYFYSNSAPWLPNAFYEEAVAEVAAQVYGNDLEHVRILCAVCGYRRVRPDEASMQPKQRDGQMDIVAAEYAGFKRLPAS